MSIHPSCSMTVNVELVQGGKFDRFIPNIGMEIEINAEGLSIDEQISAQKEAIVKVWEVLSNTLEDQMNKQGEIDYKIKFGG